MFDAAVKTTKAEELPFPYSNRTFCNYEPIEQKIEHAKVLIVNSLLRYDSDISDVARSEWGDSVESKLKFERKISSMACNNIAANVLRLVKKPKTLTVHLSELSEAVKAYEPGSVVMSGTLSDFDFYNPEQIEKVSEFLRETKIPVLAICGSHQLVGHAFGAELKTLDGLDPAEKRTDRLLEYQYRFVKIVDRSDPIFEEIEDETSGIWQDYTKEDDILRVWQNHGIQIDGVPEGFKLIASSYLCRNQMMVKRSDGQLIYGVQFHLEKSFEDWSKNPTRWEHPNESRDGRILFENFIKLAQKHNSRSS